MHQTIGLCCISQCICTETTSFRSHRNADSHRFVYVPIPPRNYPFHIHQLKSITPLKIITILTAPVSIVMMDKMSYFQVISGPVRLWRTSRSFPNTARKSPFSICKPQTTSLLNIIELFTELFYSSLSTC